MRFKDLHPNLKIRISLDFIQRISETAITSFMIIYLANSFGPTMTGILTLVMVVSATFASLYGGYYSDALGRKKILIYCSILKSISLLFIAISNSSFLVVPWITYIFFFIFTNVSSFAVPSTEAMVIDVITKETRKYVFSILYWVTNLSIGIGSIVGAFLFYSHFQVLIIANMLVSLLISWVISRYIVETGNTSVNTKERPQLKKVFTGYRLVFQDKKFLIYVLAGIMLAGLQYQLSNYIAVRLAHDFVRQTVINIQTYVISLNGLEMYGFIKTENALLVVVLGLVFTRIKLFQQRLSEQFLLNSGILLYTLGFVVITISGNVFTIIFFTFVLTIGELVLIPAKQAMIADFMKDDSRAQYFAVNYLNIRIGAILGSVGLTLGVYLHAAGMAVLYALMGFFCIYLYSVLFKGSTIKDLPVTNKVEDMT